MLLVRELLSAVVAVSGLDEKAFLMKGEIDLVVACSSGVLTGSKAKPILGAQLLGDLVVDLGYVLILLDLEEPASSLLGHTL